MSFPVALAGVAAWAAGAAKQEQGGEEQADRFMERRYASRAEDGQTRFFS